MEQTKITRPIEVKQMISPQKLRAKNAIDEGENQQNNMELKFTHVPDSKEPLEPTLHVP